MFFDLTKKPGFTVFIVVSPVFTNPKFQAWWGKQDSKKMFFDSLQTKNKSNENPPGKNF